VSTSSSGILLLFPSRDSASATSQLPSDSRRNLVDGLFGDLETGPPPVWWIVAGTAEKIGSRSGKGTDLNRVHVDELVQGRTPPNEFRVTSSRPSRTPAPNDVFRS